MRLVANTVKHAKGKSAVELRKIRPDLFKNPILKKFEFFKIPINSRPLFMPLAGEDIYLSIEDLKNYGETIVKFWDELISAMYEQN